ncbi:MAG: SGNH/GDSL hydrolase family protein [Myxococcota bacterium]
MTALRSRLSRALLVFLGTLLGVGLAELAVRAVAPREERARQNTVFHPSYGTVRRDSWVFGLAIEPDADTATVREQRVLREPDPATPRVLFIGDSGTEGVRLGPDATYPALFADLLEEEQGHRVEAINAGVFGMTTVDELHFLESELLLLRPDVVVLGVFLANDINFNLGQAFRVENPTADRGTVSWLADHSALVRVLFYRAADRGSFFEGGPHTPIDWAPELQLIDDRGLPLLSYPAGETATYLREPTDLVDEAFELFHILLERFRALGEAHRFVPAVLLIPTPSTVAGRLTLLHYPDAYGELHRIGARVEPRDLDFGAPTRRVHAICEDLELTLIDPTDRFRSRGMEAFFPDDEHPTAVGHALLARTLVDQWSQVRELVAPLPEGVDKRR